MNIGLNVVFMILIVILVIGLVLWKLRQGSREVKELKKLNDEKERFKLSSIEEWLKKRINELTTINLYGLGLSTEEFERRTRRREELVLALKNCNTGDLSSKIYVRDTIHDLLSDEYGFDDENINWTIPFSKPVNMSDREKFDTLLYLYEKTYKNKALEKLIQKYHLDELKPDGSYRIAGEEIQNIYKKEVHRLDFDDKLNIIAQRIYSSYKGFGVVDEIRDMKINGVSGGVSGIPLHMDIFESDGYYNELLEKGLTNLNSVWVMYERKTIHFSFLAFDNEAELSRVVTNLYKFGYPGQLSEKRPYIINEMYDGSRVTVVRPKMAESWAFFVRKKFDVKKLSLDAIITQKNNQLVINTLKYLVKGNCNLAITGLPGSGKTTLLMALIKYLPRSSRIRAQESFFEMNLRSLYPDLNIVTFQETDTVSGQESLDLTKKTDGDIHVLGEVATAPVAAWMIQTAQVASRMTAFTHHAMLFKYLVNDLRNALMHEKLFSNENAAERQVVSVLGFDIHYGLNNDGTSFIERVTECIPVDDSVDVLEKAALNPALASSRDAKIDLMLDAATTYFRQQTQRKQYIEHNIIEYHDGEYRAVHRISDYRMKMIHDQLSADERKDFKAFIDQFWGDAK